MNATDVVTSAAAHDVHARMHRPPPAKWWWRGAGLPLPAGGVQSGGARGCGHSRCRHRRHHEHARCSPHQLSASQYLLSPMHAPHLLAAYTAAHGPAARLLWPSCCGGSRGRQRCCQRQRSAGAPQRCCAPAAFPTAAALTCTRPATPAAGPQLPAPRRLAAVCWHSAAEGQGRRRSWRGWQLPRSCSLRVRPPRAGRRRRQTRRRGCWPGAARRNSAGWQS